MQIATQDMSHKCDVFVTINKRYFSKYIQQIMDFYQISHEQRYTQYRVVIIMVIKARNLTAERQNFAHFAPSAVISNHLKTMTIKWIAISVHRKSGYRGIIT